MDKVVWKPTNRIDVNVELALINGVFLLEENCQYIQVVSLGKWLIS